MSANKTCKGGSKMKSMSSTCFHSKPSVTVYSWKKTEQSSYVSGTGSPTLPFSGSSLRPIVQSRAHVSRASRESNQKKNKAVSTHSSPSSHLFLFKIFGDFNETSLRIPTTIAHFQPALCQHMAVHPRTFQFNVNKGEYYVFDYQ